MSVSMNDNETLDWGEMARGEGTGRVGAGALRAARAAVLADRVLTELLNVPRLVGVVHRELAALLELEGFVRAGEGDAFVGAADLEVAELRGAVVARAVAVDVPLQSWEFFELATVQRERALRNKTHSVLRLVAALRGTPGAVLPVDAEVGRVDRRRQPDKNS